jgi:peptide/nickel transport system substrate-binding protein
MRGNSPRLSRRTFVRSSLGAATLLLAACTPTAPVSPTASPPLGAATQASASGPPVTPVSPLTSVATTPNTPTTGGTLRAGLAGELTSIDGQQNLPGITATVGNAYEGLTRYDDKLQPQPVLAETWEQSTDGKQIKLNLRKGVLFHDGREFTSDDVKYSLLRLRDPKVAPIVGPLANQSAWWTRVDTPDKYTIVLGSDTPRPGVFDFFQYFNVVDKNLMDGPDATTKVNGTGPFMFVEWVQSDHVTMKRNPNYWRTGQPYLDGIETHLYRDGQAMVAGLEGGALDEVDSPTLQDLARLKDDPKYQGLVVAASGQFVCFVANTSKPPMDNKQFRQAINYAIDRQRFASTVFKGLIPGGQDLPFPPQAPASDATRNQRYTFDLDRARSLLAASGVSNPEVELVYSNTSFGDTNAPLAQIVQSDLKSIGVIVNLRPVDFPTQFDLGNRRAYNGLLLSVGSSAQLAEATSLLTRSRFFSPDPKTSFTGLDNPTYRQLINTAATEPDLAKRRDLYGQIEDILLDESASMTVSLYPQTALASARVHGLSYDFRPSLTYASAWLN